MNGDKRIIKTKNKIFRDSKSLSYRTGVSIGVVPKGLVKRVRENESLTLGFFEFDLSNIPRYQESNLNSK